VEHGTVMQLVQMRGELVQMRGGTQYNICYVACVDDVKLVQIRGETQYSYGTCAGEGWIQMRGETQYNVHLFCNLCR